LKTVSPFTFRITIRKWEDIKMDEMYMVLALFMLMGILQKPTLRSQYSKNLLLLTPFFLRLLRPSEKQEVIIKCIYLSSK
jgi:uncharacterized membrane protein YhaH (DUF805 family)